MYKDLNIENILFLDIETVPQYSSYSEVPDTIKKLWDKKADVIKAEGTSEQIYSRAGIYAEFGKIVCISFAYIRKNKDKKALFVKSIYDDDEKTILRKFNNLLNGYFNTENHYLCAHNGKEFDFPYIARRSLINGIKPADIINTPGAKPWEIKHLDTLEMWRFGDYKNWTSLELLTTIFDIPSPKTDINGSDVANVYWVDKDLQRIAEYCQQDTIALTQLFLKFMSQPTIEKELIIIK